MKNVIKKFLRELEVVAALAVIMVVFGVIQPIYFSPSNLLDILDQSVINGLLAIGMTLVIITAGIDPVSYTHLDVYKRQELPIRKIRRQW